VGTRDSAGEEEKAPNQSVAINVNNTTHKYESDRDELLKSNVSNESLSELRAKVSQERDCQIYEDDIIKDDEIYVKVQKKRKKKRESHSSSNIGPSKQK
jgi:hypothetical protein